MFAFALLLFAADTPALITRPDWAELPRAEDLVALYPASAKARELEGRAVIQCAVSADGALNDCQVTAETPAGEGFGEATLRAAGLFRMKPMTVDGEPVAGGVVRIPLRWTLADAPQDARPAADRLALAGDCVGFAQARVPSGLRGADMDDVYRYGLWTDRFVGAAVDADLKPSQIAAQMEARRIDAAARLAAGESAPAACVAERLRVEETAS